MNAMRSLLPLLRLRRRHLARELAVFILTSRIERRPTYGTVSFTLYRVVGRLDQFTHIDNLMHAIVRGSYYRFFCEETYILGVLQHNKSRYVCR